MCIGELAGLKEIEFPRLTRRSSTSEGDGALSHLGRGVHVGCSAREGCEHGLWRRR